MRMLSALAKGFWPDGALPMFPLRLRAMIAMSSRLHPFMAYSKMASCDRFTQYMQSTGHISTAICIVSSSSFHWRVHLALPAFWSSTISNVPPAHATHARQPMHADSSTKTALVSPSDPSHRLTGSPSN